MKYLDSILIFFKSDKSFSRYPSQVILVKKLKKKVVQY